MTSRAAAICAVVLLALLTACGASEEDDGGTQTPDGGSPIDGPDDPDADDGPDDGGGGDGAGDGGEGSSDALLGDEVMTAIDELVRERDVERDDVEVRVTELVTWPDASLGCPQPDEVYTQALVDGYRIVLAAEGQEFTYHGERDSPPFRCDDPQEPAAS